MPHDAMVGIEQAPCVIGCCQDIFEQKMIAASTRCGGGKLTLNCYRWLQKQKCTCDSSGPVRSREGRTDGQTNNTTSGPVRSRKGRMDGQTINLKVRSGPGKDGWTDRSRCERTCAHHMHHLLVIFSQRHQCACQISQDQTGNSQTSKDVSLHAIII